MKITEIKTNNILGARNIHIATLTPITLVCGFNGAAKSSIQESIRMALTAETVRVDLKRDYPTMISEGAKSGSTTVVTDIGTGCYELPAGTHTLEGDLKLGIPDALPFVLNAQAFAKLPDEKRRTFLFSLTNCKVTPAEVKRRLIEKKCAEEKIDLALPMLHSGFPAANKFAAEKSTESKGAWKAVTGETYGAKKGIDWTAEKPEFDNDRLELLEAELNAATELMNSRRKAVGAAEQRQADALSRKKQLKEAQDLVTNYDRLQAKLATDEKALTSYKNELQELSEKAGTTPKVGLIHELAKSLEVFLGDTDGSEQPHVIDGFAALSQYVMQYGEINKPGDPEARAKLPDYQKSVDLMERAVANTKRDISQVEIAKELLKTWGEQEDNSETDVDAIKVSMDDLSKQMNEISKELATLKKKKDDAESADERTKKASAHHLDVAAWASVAESLAPDGIPAEMLAQALKPINTILRKASIDTGWRQATITPSMQISAEGRAYNLLCESEQWRVDAMIAAAIAELSEIKILMLDRMDVLDMNGRAELLGWVDQLALDGRINTAIIFATLKQMPSGLPETITSYWLENGAIEQKEANAA